MKKKIKGIIEALREDVQVHRKHAAEHKGKAAGVVLLTLAIVGIAGGAYVYGVGHHYYEKSNYVESKTESQESAGKTARQAKAEKPMSDLEKKLKKYQTDEDVVTEDHLYNMLLVGADRTKTTKEANSDAVILISVNYEDQQVYMISLMRDTYVNIPGVGYDKLNAAYAKGGGELLMETVTENFMVEVDRYMAVSFKDMMDIIDDIGTISLTFTEAEAKNANTTMLHMCQNLGIEDQFPKYQISGEGTYECNGLQVVSYARIRKVGNADYQRTKRQREVLIKLIAKLKEMEISELNELINRMLPMITHNIPEGEFFRLLGKAPEFLGYEIKQERVPYDDQYTTRGEYLIPDWGKTYARLWDDIYGIENELEEVGEKEKEKIEN